MSERWYILGAGAIGGLFAAALTDAGLGVTLLVRDRPPPGPTPLAIHRDGRARRYRLPVSKLADHSPIGRLLITTKAQDARAATAAAAHRLRPGSRALLLVNGMGVREELQADHPGLYLACGTTTEGAWREGRCGDDWRVHHAGRGQTLVGGAGEPRTPAWFARTQFALPRCRWVDDIDSALWRKLAINCAINPLTAIHRCRNGELGTRPELAREVAALVQEIAGVCAAAGHPAVAGELPDLVRAVISATADNRSSMLQDRLAERPTEIDYITGFLLGEARRLGLDLPANRALYERLGSERSPSR